MDAQCIYNQPILIEILNKLTKHINKTLLFDLLDTVAQTSCAPNINERPRHDPQGLATAAALDDRNTASAPPLGACCPSLPSVTCDCDGQCGWCDSRCLTSTKNLKSAFKISEVTMYFHTLLQKSPRLSQFGSFLLAKRCIKSFIFSKHSRTCTSVLGPHAHAF